MLYKNYENVTQLHYTGAQTPCTSQSVGTQFIHSQTHTQFTLTVFFLNAQLWHPKAIYDFCCQ